jgi:thiamine biosynthesis protein ThiS
VKFNGIDRPDLDGCSIDELLARAGVQTRGVAVAVNAHVIRRNDWPQTVPLPSDQVEVVTATAGG